MSANEDEPGETESTQSRYWLTNDLLTAGLFLLMVGLNVAYFYASQQIPLWLQGVDGFAMTLAVVWAFGSKAATTALEVIREPPPQN